MARRKPNRVVHSTPTLDIPPSYAYRVGQRAAAYLLWTPLQIGRDMVQLIRKVDPDPRLLMHFAGQIALTLVGNYVIFLLRTDLMKQFGELDNYIFKRFSEEDVSPEDWEKFMGQIYSIATPLTGLVLAYTVDNFITNKYSTWFRRQLTETLHKKLLGSTQVAAALSHNLEMSEILRTLDGDIRDVSATGVSLLSDAASSMQNGLLSLGPLLRASKFVKVGPVPIPDFLMLSLAYSWGTQLISNFFSTRIKQITDLQTTASIQDDAATHNDYMSIKTITARGPEALTRVYERQHDNRQTFYRLQDRVTMWGMLHGGWSQLHSWLNMLYKNVILGAKVFTKQIASDDVYVTWNHFSNVDNCVSWAEQNQTSVKLLHAPMLRVHRFLDEEQRILSTQKTLKLEHGGTPLLTLRNLTLSINGKKILYIHLLQFKPGESYVLTGAKGSGKSSLVAKINGVLQDNIDAKGTIQYPDNARIITLSQEGYFPGYGTLLEALCFPSTPPASGTSERQQMLAQIKRLLKEANIDEGCKSDHPDSIISMIEAQLPNWRDRLSGGQQKIVQVVSAILQQPTIVILDETFANMDRATIETVQHMLHKYLPHATKITIDHNAIENNFKHDGKPFYGHHLHLSNKALTAQGRGGGRG